MVKIIVGSAQVLIVPTFKGLQKAIGKGLVQPLEQGVGAANPGARIGDKVVRGLGTALKFGAGAVIATSAAAVGTALVQGFGRLQALENARATLEGLGHSAQGVETIMDDALASVKGTAFGMGEAATTAASAVAAGVKPGKDLQRTLTLVGDAATIAQTDMATMGSIVNKVSTSNKMQMDVANQLMDAGIPILQMVGDELGVTAEEARKMASAGEISFETFQNALEEGVGGAALKSGDTLAGAFANTKASLGRIGASLLEPFYGMAGDFLNWAMNMLGPIEEWAESIKPLIQDSLEQFTGWIQTSFIPAAKNVINAFRAIGEWVVANKDWLIPLTIAVGAFIAAFMGVLGVKSAIDSVKTSFALLNVVMKANPIGLVIAGITALVAGLVWFFTQTEVGQKAWAWFTDALVAAWEWVSDVFTNVWENYLSPVFEGIGTVVTWLWENIFSPFIGYVIGLWASLGEVFQWVWDNVLSHVFAAIGAIAVWLWETVLQPVFSWIGDHWHYVTDAMKWAWDYILKPVFDAIAFVAKWLWDTVLEPVFSWIGDHWDEILFAMKFAWENYLKPAWENLRDTISWLWHDILSPIFSWIGDKWDDMSRGMSYIYDEYLKPMIDKFGDIIEDLKSRFETAVDNIKAAWDKIKSVAAQPIKFVIERVLNDGLIAGFNKLVDWIPGVTGLKEIPLPKWMDGYARGGWTGPGGKYDPAGIVHADEFVINKASRRRFEHLHPGLLTHINDYGRLDGYASGGLVRPVNGRFTSGFGASRGRYPHAGVDWAVPIGTPVKAALAGTALGRQPAGRTGRYVFLAHPGNRNTYYGHLSRPMVSPGDQVSKGQIIGLSGNTGRSTGPHLHFETWTGGKPVDPMRYMGGLPASEDGGSGWFDPLAPFRAIGDSIKGWITDKFPDGGIIVDAALNAATGSFKSIIDWASGLIGGSGDPSDSDAGSGSAQQQVRDVATRFGWNSGAQWSALSQLIQRESSWNVNAANPRSSARGLFQKMTSIHGPVAGTAGGQAEWGLPYIKNRHGSPAAALAFHNRNNWYADGGHVNPGVLFRDQGGNLPPGLSMVLNNTGRDEHIFNHEQLGRLEHAVSGRGGNTYHIDARGQGQMSGNDLVHRLDFEQRRKSKGGVYA